MYHFGASYKMLHFCWMFFRLTQIAPPSGNAYFDDDGGTKSAYEKGLYELLEIKSMHFDSFVLFTFNRKEAFNYNGKPATRNIELLIHGYNSKPGKIQTGRVPVKNALSKQAYQTTKTQISFWDSEKELLQIKFQSSESITNLQIIF